MADDDVESEREKLRNKNRNDERLGLRCPGCGCRDFRTPNVVEIPDAVRRYKQCRNCGKRIRTREARDDKK